MNAALDYVGTQTGRILKRGTQTQHFDCFGVLELIGDNPSDVVVTYLDDNGVSQTLPSSVYGVKTHKARPYITLAHGEAWPSTQAEEAAITVTYTAGYDANSVPDALKSAVLIEAATNYEFRENESIVKTNRRQAVERLIMPYVVFK